MPATRVCRILLGFSALIAVGVGGAILFAPVQFYAMNDIDLAVEANLLSEVRAPGGLLLVLGLAMGIGAFVRSFTRNSLAIAATVFLAYGVSRLLSIALDGAPGSAMVGATAVELVIGLACAAAWIRLVERRGVMRSLDARCAPAGEWS